MAGKDDQTTPAGWYRQKDDPTVLRWWDGATWTDDAMPVPSDLAARTPGAGSRSSSPAAPRSSRTSPRAGGPSRSGTTVRTSAATRSGSPRRSPAAGTTRTRTGTGRESRVVRRGPGDLGPLGRVAVRALLIAGMLGALFLVYERISGSGAGDARTIAEVPEAVEEDPDAPPLAGAVLNLSDLPAGWAVQADDVASDDICHGRKPLSVLAAAEVHSAGFTKGPEGPYLANVVARFPTTAIAREFMDLTARVVDSCRGYEVNGTTIRLEPLDFPGLGDETFAVAATGTSPSGPLEGEIVYVRVGNRVASLRTILIGESGINTQLVEHLARLLSRCL